MSKAKVDIYKLSNSPNQIVRITEGLKMLNLMGAIAFLEKEAQKAVEEHLTFYDFLENLIEKEREVKEDSRIRRCVQQAKFPYIKTLKDFNFYSENLEEIDITLIQELASCRFIGLRELISLVNKIKQDAEKERRLMATFIRPKLLILDEIGLYNASPKVNDFIFRVLIQRYENQNSVIFTSNKDIGQWGPLFGDEERAVIIRGKSFRIEHKSNLQNFGEHITV